MTKARQLLGLLPKLMAGERTHALMMETLSMRLPKHYITGPNPDTVVKCSVKYFLPSCNLARSEVLLPLSSPFSYVSWSFTMAKGNPLRIDPFYPNGQQDFLPLASSSKSALSALPTSAIFPYLRKTDTKHDPPLSNKHKNPLLTLKLSSISFLDSTVNDGLSDNALYTIKTTSACTTVSRNDPWEGPTKVADLRWAKRSAMKGKGKENIQSSSVVEMNGGRTKTVEQFLRQGPFAG